MSTNANIGIVNDNGTVTAIYLHWDGSPEEAGRTLVQHYQDESKVKQLIGLGAISVLDKNIGDKIDFDDLDARDQNEQCLAYGRDRGEPASNVAPTTVRNADEFLSYSSAPYLYLYSDGEWSGYRNNGQEISI